MIELQDFNKFIAVSKYVNETTLLNGCVLCNIDIFWLQAGACGRICDSDGFLPAAGSQILWHGSFTVHRRLVAAINVII